MRLRDVVILGAALATDVACAKVQCQYNSECGDRARCVENRCVTDCFVDRDCPAATPVCSQNGECVPLATDAGTVDGTPEDAAAGLDAAVEDAPALDAQSFDVIAPQDLVTTSDVVTATDVPAPRDVVSVSDVPAPRDVVSVSDVPAPRDVVTAADAGGTVTPGFYDYTGVRPDALRAPAAVAWHPSGGYALILSSSDTVFRYDAATQSVAQVARTSSGNGWRHLSFTPDGARALLLGSTGSGATRTGRVYLWDHATQTLAERTSDALSGGGYDSIAWSPDGTRGVLLANRQPSGSANIAGWWLDAQGQRGTYAFAYGLVSGTGCEDLDFNTDGFGDPTLAVVCGVNTGMILTVSSLDASPRVSVAQSSGSVGNVSRIATHPRRALSLAIGSSSSRLYRLRQGVWEVGFNSPTVSGSYDVTFNDDGSRALAFGGNGRVWEFRTDLYSSGEIRDVSISGLGGPPYNQPTNATLRALAWRPGCDEGLAVGGASSPQGTSAFVAYFRVTNGRACAR